MPLTIAEIFGYSPVDQSPLVKEIQKAGTCPFTSKKCIKVFRDSGVVHGTCTVKTPSAEEVICCPKRLYADKYRILTDVAIEAFGAGMKVIPPSNVEQTTGEKGRVVAFGSGWGKELRVPKSGGQKGSYSADWVLALISESNDLAEFVALEVQSMDTTGNYQPDWCKQMGVPYNPKVATKKKKASNINWENVNKRIIPQLLTKGNVFQREKLCSKGMFFVTPTPVYKRVIQRLGATLSEFPLQHGALTFRYYGLEPSSSTPATIRQLVYEGQYTTTVENLKEAFNSTLNLPPMNSITAKIVKALKSPAKLKKKPNEGKDLLISG